MEVLHRGRRALKPGKGQIRDWPGRQSRRVETAMFTLPYNPVAVVPWIVGGLLSGLIFKSSARSPISGKHCSRISRSWHYGHAAPSFVRGRQ